MKRRLAVVTAVAVSAASLTGVALAASSPAVTTGAASSVKPHSAVLNGTINPNGSKSTYYFQWGLTNSYGVNGAIHSTGAGTKAVSVHETASGLIPGTIYHYRLVATNAQGTSAGKDHTFKSTGHAPPGVSTGPTSQVSQNSATVTGVINPNGQATSWAFQYGLSTAYGSQTFSRVVPAGSAPVTVSQLVQGLAPGTIFHYRLVGSHTGSGSSLGAGADQIFMTYPAHRPVPVVTRRVRPLHAKHKPFKPWLYTVSGTVSRPSSTPSQFACTGFVGIRFFTGGRRVNFALATLQPNCTYSAQLNFHRRPGKGKRNGVRTLHVLVHFRGNGYVAPGNARVQAVTLG